MLEAFLIFFKLERLIYHALHPLPINAKQNYGTTMLLIIIEIKTIRHAGTVKLLPITMMASHLIIIFWNIPNNMAALLRHGILKYIHYLSLRRVRLS
jgi:hypothetical protein